MATLIRKEQLENLQIVDNDVALGANINQNKINGNIVNSVREGDNILIDDTDPKNPIINAVTPSALTPSVIEHTVVSGNIVSGIVTIPLINIPSSDDWVIVYLNGVKLLNSAYNVSGTNLQITQASLATPIETGDEVEVLYKH